MKEGATGIATFESPASTRLVFGAGAVARVGSLVKDLGGTRALIVTDPGIVGAGHCARVAEALRAEGIAAEVYDRVRENPTTLDVDQCVAAAREHEVDFLVGLGGGSSMDTAKGCNFILTNGGQMKDYWGVGKATKPMLPLIAIPTTSGTGSECQSFALIADETTHAKMACGDVKAAAKVALLDPELTLSQPRRVTACTGVDALAHALESAVTKKRTPISKLYSFEAFRLIIDALPRVLADGSDLEARGSMLLGAALAGLAIENSMLGAAHSAANPLTAHYGVVHGQAVGVMLPHIVAFNGKDPTSAATYRELEATANVTETLVSTLHSILQQAALETTLTPWQIPDEKIPTLAQEAAAQWTANFNPRPIEATDFEAIYRAANTAS